MIAPDLLTLELAPLHLKPSELLISHDPYEVTTVLGSCVAVTMFGARLGLAAICHAMLPAPGQGLCLEAAAREPYKFVSFVVPFMAEAFRRAGLRPAEIEVKIFGGANLIGRHAGRDCPHCVGPANVRMAALLLEGESLRIRASNVGGGRGRKIVFNTRTGEVMHKHLC
jgi:chemotaxis protein CheD